MKKGQAAMEFLMTYGWAILVVIAAIAALAYFGVLDPARLLPERCQFPAGMDCIDKAAIDATADSVTVALRNNLAFAITVSNAVLTDASGAVICGAANTNKFVDNGDGNLYVDLATRPTPTVANNGVFRVRVDGCTLAPGDKFDGKVTVTYTNTESGLTNSAIGDVRGRAG